MSGVLVNAPSVATTESELGSSSPLGLWPCKHCAGVKPPYSQRKVLTHSTLEDDVLRSNLKSLFVTGAFALDCRCLDKANVTLGESGNRMLACVV